MSLRHKTHKKTLPHPETHHTNLILIRVNKPVTTILWTLSVVFKVFCQKVSAFVELLKLLPLSTFVRDAF